MQDFAHDFGQIEPASLGAFSACEFEQASRDGATLLWFVAQDFQVFFEIVAILATLTAAITAGRVTATPDL